jgi:phytoene dehydrogenase-like protein
MPTARPPDVLVLGAGMAGLTVAALLATNGRRVQVLEAHDHAGGYAHSFPMGAYRFCAQVHYVFGCEQGGSVWTLLRRLGLADEVRFLPLDPDGFDHVVVGGDRYRIPNGFVRFCDRLAQQFPAQRDALHRYFTLLQAVRDELDRLPGRVGLLDLATAPLRFPRLLRWRGATLGEVFDTFHLPPRLRAVLAGQCGDYLLPPGQVSFLLHVALTAGYDRGAFYPERHYGHFVDRIVETIRAQPGCSVELGVEAEHIQVEGDRVVGVRSTDGRVWSGRTVVSNIDPARTAALCGAEALPARWLRKLRYAYSGSTFTLYLGLSGLDLRAHGFGRWNVWHYPHDDLDRIYADQVDRGDLSDPWLFLSTPTLHSRAPGLAPEGHEVLVAATSCSHARFQALEAAGRAAYLREKTRIRARILDVLEEKYLPGLRRHIDLRVAGTPTTNQRFCWAPEGNAYGAALTPANVGLGRVPFETPFSNLFLVNATAGYPSVAGTVGAGLRLFEILARRGS